MRERWATALLIGLSILALIQASPYISQPAYGTTLARVLARVAPFQIVNSTTQTNTTTTGSMTSNSTTSSTTTVINSTTTTSGRTTTALTNTTSITSSSITSSTTSRGSNVSITIDSFPHGMGIVTVDANSVTTPTVFTFLNGSMHDLSAVGSFGCGASCQWVFQSWSDGGGQTHTITVPNSPATYTATFQKQYLLTIQSNAGGSVAPPSGYQNANAEIPILATPNSGFTFVSWTGSGSGSFNGSSPSASVMMNGPIGETATFAPTSNVQITVTSSPSSASTIRVDGSFINTPQTYTWTPGTTHALFATFNPPCNYNCQATFQYWSSPTIGTVYSQSITYTVPPSTETVTATYRITQNAVSITIASVPSGLNSVIVDGTQITTSQTYSWTVGSTHTLTANQYCGTLGCPTVLRYWQSSSVGTITAASFTYTVPSYSETVSAYYQASQNVPIVITEIPGGSGPIVVDGVPIIVPQTFYWTSGTTHTLSAQGGYRQFVSWGSPSIGSVNANSITYVVPYTGETVAAYYIAPAPSNLIPITITTSVSGPTVAVDGIVTTTPHTYFWTAGTQHTISTSNVNCQPSGCQIQFNSWTSPSIGITYTGTITYTVPFAGETVTANFTQPTPISEFNGVAVVVALILATSLCVLKRRRR